MYYVVGLGNPGAEYKNTRHNVGWLALDALIVSLSVAAITTSAKYSGRVSEGNVSGQSLVFLYPDTFMNHSGSAVKKLVPKGETSQLIVLYDDVDIPLGEIKVSFGRGAGGHNGVASVIASLGTRDFIRIRIGVAKAGFWPWEQGVVKRPKGGDALLKHVLGQFTRREEAALARGLSAATDAIKLILKSGHVAAMNQYN